MKPFPFSEEDWSEVWNATLAVTNATLTDDRVLRDSAHIELEELIGRLCKKYGDHPVLLETLADFESDVTRRIALYQEAIRQSERYGLSTVTPRLALATVLMEQNPSEARQVLMDCERELATHGDKSDVEAWSSLRRKCEQCRELGSQARRADRE